MQPIRRSSLFLMELMIAILLFSLAAAICVPVFVKSHSIKEKSTELNQAVLASVSVAEIIRSEGISLEMLSEAFPEAESADHTLYISYDQKWSPCAPSDAVYTLRVGTKLELTTSDSSILTGEITVYRAGQEGNSIYELAVKKYIPKEDTFS